MIKFPMLLTTLFGAAIAVSAAAEGELPGLNSLLIPTLVIILLIILNALFVAAEFAIIAVRPTKIEQLVQEGNILAKPILSVLQSTNRQNRYIATAQLGITIASLGLGMYGEPQISHFIEPWMAKFLGVSPHDTLIMSAGYLISLTLLTYLHVVAGEMIPKSLALAAPDKTVLGISQPMRFMQTILVGPVWLLNSIGAILLRIFRIPPVQGEERLHTPEELEMIVQESAQGGMLSPSEEIIIRNILDFSSREVHQVMTPRPKVHALPFDMPLPDILNMVANSNFSRFPVYETDLDHIIGIVHIKDLVRQHIRTTPRNFDIRLLLRPVHLVPEHYPVDKLMTTFKRRRHHMAIVLDEFGGTAGIVTLEDLVEEVVGEVRDEFDSENEPLIKLAPGKLDVAGDYLLDDLADVVDIGHKEDMPDVETVGGLIMATLGRVPQTGDTVTLPNGITLTVLSVTKLAVDRAQVEFPVPPPDSTE